MADRNFSKAVEGWVRGTTVEMDQQVRAIILALFRSVILGTPVDKGRARGNWQTTVGAPAVGTLDTHDPSGAGSVADVTANSGGSGVVTWLTNNLPYIGKLEFGGYRDGPKTIGGFSTQAPQGMVRVNLARIAALLQSNRRP